MTGTAVTDIDKDHVHIGERTIPASVVLWAAGVAASPLGKLLRVPLDRAGRVVVGPDLSIPGYPNVFALGDMAAALQENGKPVPGVAPAAMQMGKFAAGAILDDLRGKPRKVFHYLNKGNLATIGRSSAVADVGGMKLSGHSAWFTWLFVHVLFLVGFRNRITVVWDWFWAYISFQRGARLITGVSRSIIPPAAAMPQAHATQEAEPSHRSS
jgi:NADH dehydrogenase